ncbi:Small RNA 2'-O-methyltransferase [Podila humilis]|nr:Small RNA 2'-O-methyltransferase [Podila humilis]
MDEDTPVRDNDEKGMEVSFSIPLWMQRRQFIRQVIDENKATSVIDFGCGEAALTSILIGETWQDHQITRIACVDVDPACITEASEICQPQDYDLDDGLRVHDLKIDFYQGSVDQVDERLMGYEALACAEVVEHLNPDVLSGFWKTVLGSYKPKLVIVTTPNAEFNVNFPQLNYGTPESTFRHWDHKFEWTRKEFEDWCTTAAQKYDYTVSFAGVGWLPQQDPAVGCCTQIAILKQVDPVLSTPCPPANGSSLPYSLHSSIDYPVYRTIHTDEEILPFLHETIAHIRPRLPIPEDDVYSYWDHISGSDSPRPSDNETEPVNTEQIVLGRLPLESLWSISKARQLCRSRSTMIAILHSSSLVKLDATEDIITFDEDNSFWKECDDRYEAAWAKEEDTNRLDSEMQQDENDRESSCQSDDGYSHANDTYYQVVSTPEPTSHNEDTDITMRAWDEHDMGDGTPKWGSRAWDPPLETASSQWEPSAEPW